MVKLGVNIDHVATLRQARQIEYPDPVYAAVLAELGGADGITVHLREDRRHIQSRDVFLLRQIIKTRLNLEMAATREMVNIAGSLMPDMVTLVPEKREELTTEGGLDVVKNSKKIGDVKDKLFKKGIKVFVFVDADKKQIKECANIGVDGIEIHTGRYADAKKEEDMKKELLSIIEAAKFSVDSGLVTSAGHGLHYRNVEAIAAIPDLYELNIGHSIIAQAVFVGIEKAVRQMKEIILKASLGKV
ncbi:MAG: pyridoxine 5'-phosphate synthase [bacterium]